MSLAEAERQLAGVAAALAVEYPETNHGWSVRLLPLAEDTVGTAAAALWLLLGAVALLLAVASANVALLTLLRGLDRATDTALRLALGASSARLVREFLMESLLLATAGGLLGAAIAVALLRALPTLAPDLPRVDEVTLDAAGAALRHAPSPRPSRCCRASRRPGAAPGWLPPRRSPTPRCATTDGGRRHLFRDGMVVAQVALAVVLLLGSGLLVRSVRALGAVDPGYDPRGVLVVPVFLDSQGYASGERSRTYYRTLFDALASLPGVVAVGGATTVPTSPLGPDFERPVWPEGTSPAAADRTPASVRVVTPGYFPALGLRVAGGRAFDDRDTPTGPLVVMVNESLARRLWPGQSAVGRQLVVDYSTAGTYPYRDRRRGGGHAISRSAQPAAAGDLPGARAAAVSHPQRGGEGRRRSTPAHPGRTVGAPPGRPAEAAAGPVPARGPARRDLRQGSPGDDDDARLRRRGHASWRC